MAVYFIDGDNAPGTRTQGIENLTENDEVVVFYAKSTAHYSSENIRKTLEENTKAKLSFVQVPDGKNAVDFAVAARAGFYAATTESKIFLISVDKHFDMVADIIGKQILNGRDIKRVETLSRALIGDAENIATLDIAENLIKINFGIKEGEAFMKRIKELAVKEKEPYEKSHEPFRQKNNVFESCKNILRKTRCRIVKTA